MPQAEINPDDSFLHFVLSGWCQGVSVNCA